MGEVTALTAVLDTSVLWGRDLRGELIRAIDAGRFVGVWSDWIVAELWRGEFHLDGSPVDDALPSPLNKEEA